MNRVRREPGNNDESDRRARADRLTQQGVET